MMDDQQNKSESIPTYRRKLPHWHPQSAMYFITFRLANSLPTQIIQELQSQREHEREIICAQWRGAKQQDALYKLDKKYFGYFDAWLDRCVAESPNWLADHKVAQIVANEISALDGERYRLVAYCIMSNHGHLVIDTNGYDFKPIHTGVTVSYPLADTLKRFKGRTARFCNQALRRNGHFWHHESYDHVIRDEQEYQRIVWYTLNNPVKAGLVKRWEDWQFTFITPGL